MDLRDDRLELARSVGMKDSFRADDPDLVSKVSSVTSGIGLDHVFLCAASESSEPVNLAARLVRSRGQVIVVGRVGMQIERKDFYQKELRLLMTRSLGPGRYDPTYEEKGIDYPVEYVRWTLNRNMQAFMALAESGLVNVSGLVGGEFPLTSAADAYESLGTQAKVAVLLSYGQTLTSSSPTTVKGPPRTSRPGRINVALVGPGNFAKETLIPLLRSSPEYNLRWIVSSNPVHASQLEKRYRFEKSTCNYSQALEDPEVGVVVISAPNNLHATMLSAAIEARKMALVEKPLCITREEFEQIRKLQAVSGMPIVVGFNRRYAPLVLEMKERMHRTAGPFVINYRVNAGFVPASRWSQDPSTGGGRIIHECCHFFDLFNFLLESGTPRISAVSAGVTGSTSVARDNLSVALTYPDGSIAHLSYVAIGGNSMERERMETFGGGCSMVLDDYKALTIYGKKTETLKSPRADKGHRGEFQELAKLVKGKPTSIISTEEVFSATELTFRVDEAARGTAPA
jgi:predicted dehydrogenase